MGGFLGKDFGSTDVYTGQDVRGENTVVEFVGEIYECLK